MNNYQKSYEWLNSINSLKLDDKSVIVIGGGNMAKQYIHTLLRMNITNIAVISKSKESADLISNEFRVRSFSGGFERNLPLMNTADLVIIATPIPFLPKAAKTAIECGQNNILLEKPGSIHYQDLLDLKEKINSQKIRIAYNRLAYPSYHKLKEMISNDGGITSCRFTFTEKINSMNFNNNFPEVFNRLGISNSLHPIVMAIELIGMPKEISTFRSGTLNWHKSGSIFVGSGITENNIPFSYHADWNSAGRWSVEIMTRKNAYRLAPLEELYVSHRGNFNWDSIPIMTAFPDTKPGIAEEIALMLDVDAESNINLITLEKAIKFNQLAEKIFGYE